MSVIPTFSIESITPDDARNLLQKTDKHPLNSNLVKAYGAAMKSEGWILNGMPIILDTSGKVLDGVHRLNACISVDKAFNTVVARNIKEDVLHTIDQHRRRIYTNVLESRGYDSPGTLTRMMSKLIRIENGLLGVNKYPISWLLYDRVLETNKKLQPAVQIAKKFNHINLHSTARPVLAFMALSAGHAAQINSFYSVMEDPQKHSPNNPARMLSMQLEINNRENVDHDLALAILAFNDFLQDKEVNSAYKWAPDFGIAEIDRESQPLPYRLLKQNAPPNLGMPVVDGYLGLMEGKFSKEGKFEFRGRTADTLKKASQAYGDPIVKLVTVPPQLAQEWLDRYNRKNRNTTDAHVDKYARDIENGRWMLNAQPICFTGSPENETKGTRLLNGQHRLKACIKADFPIEILVAYGLSPAAFATYDFHSKRQVHMAASEPKIDRRVHMAAAKFQWRLDTGQSIFSAGSPSASELIATCEKHPDLTMHYAHARRLSKIGSTGVMMFLIYHTTSQRSDLAESFLDSLETGAMLTNDNPILKVRNSFIGKRSKTARKDVLGTLLKTWVKYIKWNDDLKSNLGA